MNLYDTCQFLSQLYLKHLIIINRSIYNDTKIKTQSSWISFLSQDVKTSERQKIQIKPFYRDSNFVEVESCGQTDSWYHLWRFVFYFEKN